jgi:hypothetical protein
MEQEFKKTGLNQHSPAFGKLVIESLRKRREEHPFVDMAAGMLPIVGGLQSGMDVADTSKSNFDRGMSALSFVPGGKLLGMAGKYIPGIDKLRGAGNSAISYMGDVVDINKLKKQKETAKKLREAKGGEQIVMDTSGLPPHDPNKGGMEPNWGDDEPWTEEELAELEEVRKKFQGKSVEEAIAEKLREPKDLNDFSQWGDEFKVAGTTDKAIVAAKNEESRKIAEQYLKDEGIPLPNESDKLGDFYSQVHEVEKFKKGPGKFTTFDETKLGGLNEEGAPWAPGHYVKDHDFGSGAGIYGPFATPEEARKWALTEIGGPDIKPVK